MSWVDKLLKVHGLESNRLPTPFFQFNDLLYNGSIKPKSFVSKSDFVFINRVIMSIGWSSASGTYSWGNFANSTALTEGLIIKYGGKPLGLPIKTNHDFNRLAYDVSIRPDTDASKKIHLGARLSFTKINYKQLGLPVHRDNRRFEISVNDELTHVNYAIDEIYVIYQGWRWSDV